MKRKPNITHVLYLWDSIALLPYNVCKISGPFIVTFSNHTTIFKWHVLGVDARTNTKNTCVWKIGLKCLPLWVNIQHELGAKRERERGPIWPFDVELRISFWRWSRFSYELWKIWGKWLSIPNWNWKLSQLIVCSGTYEKWVMPQRDYPKPPTLSLVYVIECIVHGHINLHGVEWAWDGVSTNSSLRKMRTQWTTHSSCYNLVNL